MTEFPQYVLFCYLMPTLEASSMRRHLDRKPAPTFRQKATAALQPRIWGCALPAQISRASAEKKCVACCFQNGRRLVVEKHDRTFAKKQWPLRERKFMAASSTENASRFLKPNSFFTWNGKRLLPKSAETHNRSLAKNVIQILAQPILWASSHGHLPTPILASCKTRRIQNQISRILPTRNILGPDVEYGHQQYCKIY